jgi:hypothetical protein
MSETTKPQVKDAVLALVEVARETHKVIKHETLTNPLGGIPSGHLYARLMHLIELDTYNLIIDTLKRVGLVREQNHLLIAVDCETASA